MHVYSTSPPTKCVAYDLLGVKHKKRRKNNAVFKKRLGKRFFMAIVFYWTKNPIQN
jgi:hypothetical protein